MKPVLILIGLIVVISALALVERSGSTRLVEPLPIARSAADEVLPLQPPATEADETAAVTPPPLPSLNLADFSEKCFRAIRERNPRGRLLRLNANRLGDRCSGIVETRQGSARWLFDWRNQENWIREGELLMPDIWPKEIPEEGIPANAFSAEEISTRVEAALAQVGDLPHDEWLYEILWMPAPFSRTLSVITLLDTGPEASDYASYTYYFDGARILNDDEEAQASERYALTRFELREDHNYKGPLYESTALAEAPISLETDPNAGPDSALIKSAESCMDWLHKVNNGSRVLRVAINAERCFITLENAAARDDFYLLTTKGSQNLAESPSLQIDVDALPNLMLDRSRVTMPRLRERLSKALAQSGGENIDRLAIFWLNDERMLWQFSQRANVLAYLDESGEIVNAPSQFPITRAEIEQQFPASSPVMDVIAEK